MEGINNLGSTCAINSLIQIITRNDDLRNLILNSNVSTNTFTSELKEILDLLHNQHKNINPIKFINYFYTTFKDIFNKHEQIDINELWFYFYKKINEETSYDSLNKNSLNKISNIHEEHNYKLNIYNENKESELMKLVQGSYINIIECSNCKNKTHSFEPFITLNLDIIDNENVSIVDLIINALNNEYREKDDWKCDNCNGKHAYIKTTRIWKLPKLLFISLNRFKEFNKKNNTEVIINNNLNFNKGSIMNENKDIILNLESIGLHYGDIYGGHYKALCNMKNGNYHLFNDENINIITEDNLFKDFKNSNAYLLLYNNIDCS
jgi:ubiquitin C-terminal hydrolase